jgi:CelD/BcsL family acetyltransferase involved in cellulose biosynthesis
MRAVAMDVYALDPLEDPRWAALVEGHPRASVFHTPGWLRAIQRTYGFAPIAFTTCRPGEPLTNAVVFCAVRSWLSGRRLVSLPFSDHCEPLVESAEEWQALCEAVLRRRGEGRWRYVELRPASETAAPEAGFRTAQTFYLHRLDLRPDLSALLRSFHKDSIQRKIRRAERERLSLEAGRSEALLERLLHLLDLTRRRHQAPLQPLAWFRNLIDCLGERVTIRIAAKDGEPAAGILTLAHGDRVVYKYGGSDARLHALGGMPFLFWRTIQDARAAGARELDLGRSDQDNPGLVAFKEHLAATRSTLTYWRAPAAARAATDNGWTVRIARRIYARLPGGVRRAAGRLIYPHIA